MSRFEHAITTDWQVSFGKNMAGINFIFEYNLIQVIWADNIVAVASWRNYQNKNELVIIDIEVSNEINKDLALLIKAFLMRSLSARCGPCCIVIENSRIY